MIIKIKSDGGARGNPGPAGIGAVLYKQNDELLTTISQYIGIATNNQAEYKAIIAALKKAIELKATEIIAYLDSELIVKQVKGEYRVKNKDLAPLFLELHNLKLSFKKSQFIHIPREENKEADRLANQAMDEQYKN